MEAIILLDAVPVFVDIKSTDLNIDPARIEDAITPRTRAIMPVPIFGAPCDMDAINEIATRRGLEVVMDNAQAFGTIYRGRQISSCGRMATLSFYPTKNLPGIGDGGAVCCRDKADAELIRRLRAHQVVRANGHLYTGWNSRLDEVQAMVIRIRLARFAEEQHDRDQVAAIYDSYIPAECRVQLDDGGHAMRMTYHQYWVRSADRDGLRRALDKAGIDVGIYYDPPLHKHELAVYCRAAGDLPEAERAGREIIALPIHAALPFADAHRVGEVVRGFMSTGKAAGA
jgi:dTDP-4-amino-4,6-dideoxygalactose transaminase